jgi:hypothetical protein
LFGGSGLWFAEKVAGNGRDYLYMLYKNILRGGAEGEAAAAILSMVVAKKRKSPSSERKAGVL